MDSYGGEGESFLFPKPTDTKDVPLPPTVLDIGCGFCGLTLALAAIFPEETILGLEIRAKVTEYVRLRIVAARNDPAAHHINPHALATSIPISDTTPAALKPTLTGALRSCRMTNLIPFSICTSTPDTMMNQNHSLDEQ
jgi:Putative methyltransferase